MERYIEKIETILLGQSFEKKLHTYSSVEGLRIIGAELNGERCIIADGSKAFRFEGDHKGGASGIRVCPMNHTNRVLLNREFPYTAPASLGNVNEAACFTEFSMEGSEDLLKTMKEAGIGPVLVRQNPLSGEEADKAFETAVDEAAWAVYCAGYREGYGTCIEGVSSAEEVSAALEHSVSMIALNAASAESQVPADEEERARKYQKLDEDLKQRLAGDYLMDPDLAEAGIFVDQGTLEETVLRYSEIVNLIEDVFRLMRRSMRRLDLEVSLKDVTQPTAAFAHCFIAAELERRRVHLNAIELKDPEPEDLRLHCMIAERFGHRISADGCGRMPELLKGEKRDEVNHFQETGRICLRRQTEATDRQ